MNPRIFSFLLYESWKLRQNILTSGEKIPINASLARFQNISFNGWDHANFSTVSQAKKLGCGKGVERNLRSGICTIPPRMDEKTRSTGSTFKNNTTTPEPVEVPAPYYEVHIFPEGKINPKTSLLRFKWGVGRLMMESTNPPIVIPLWFKGPEEIMPEGRGSKYWIPICGKKVVITYGQPIDFKDTLTNYYERKVEEIVTRVEITDTIFQAINELQKKTHSLEDGRNNDS
ncbi:11429_t:CDS:2 [Acaulospora colombiana]|uniref:11429_t:CDS:1 n=1 Tax=Acaulospora colombiana TaxID=27376 RepID=A0ACA9LRN6_9GLOM|nr:11429_t:CDS:2 [Acaulospora colombiana]